MPARRCAGNRIRSAKQQDFLLYRSLELAPVLRSVVSVVPAQRLAVAQGEEGHL